VLPLTGWRSIIVSHQALAIVFIVVAVPILVTMLVIFLRAGSERRRLLRGFDDRLRMPLLSRAKRSAKKQPIPVPVQRR
jgi:ABC-type transport system involved in cytochrome bd biosynthesis fused ATPase/permease subunit